MAIELKENEIVTYGDIKITASTDEDFHEIIKIETNHGELIVRPKAYCLVTIESTDN